MLDVKDIEPNNRTLILFFAKVITQSRRYAARHEEIIFDNYSRIAIYRRNESDLREGLRELRDRRRH